MSVLLLATYDSKEEEAAYLEAALARLDVPSERVDLSLRAQGVQWSAAGKVESMGLAAQRAIDEIAFRPWHGRRMVVAIGGGTGGQIALQVLRALPIEMPKLLVSTLPFDPRHALADNAIIVVPTVADLTGLNATVRQALDRAAAITAGLFTAELPQGRVATQPSIGVTALGVTAPGVDALNRRLRAQGHETTVFHANGFGGAAFARWCRAGAFSAVIDYTTHELTRLHVAGIRVDMPDRFTVAGALPRVVVPGGVNFVGMGEPRLMPEAYRARPHYRHSPLFTHVKITREEAARCAFVLASALSEGSGPCTVLVPMEGFSSEDRPGGAIEDPDLRHVFADALEQALPPHIPLTRLPWHVNDARCAEAAADALAALSEEAHA
jgi:uncharacterized protein (UPF0261 family)